MNDNSYTKEGIIHNLQEASLKVITWISEQEEGTFAKLVDDKWSTAQQLDHLIKSKSQIVLTLGKPKFFMRLLFGRPNRETRPYAVVVEKYKAKLLLGGVAPKQFIPQAYSVKDKRTLIDKYAKLSEKLERKVSGLSEKDLDAYILPHPLLGKLTLREMMFFTIYHTNHHMEAMRNLYGSTI
jgi:DinB superfamily